MKKIGIITFHAFHNHGAALQAYATQKIIESIGYESEIINYRLKQNDFYTLYRTKFGMKYFIQDLIQLPIHYERKKRYEKFEEFISKDMKISSNEYSNPIELEKLGQTYDMCLSGSDQIWNYYVPSIKSSGKEYIKPFFLDFAKCKKISYASCIGGMKKNEVYEYKEMLNKYDYISTREDSAAEILESVLGRRVETVMDPTFLLNKDEWSSVDGKERIIDEPYILLYSLYWIKKGIRWYKGLIPFAKKFNFKIVCITPYFSIPSSKVINMPSAGPKDFLNLIKNADVVCTDSFHGAAFSVNFQKPFYVLGNKYWKEDIRKTALLEKLGLMNRMIENEIDLADIKDYNIDYSNVEPILSSEIKKSMLFLEGALRN